ncbi:Cysteine-rich receptor-like protein kinase 6 [Capsicum annuum]|nr:Cysteine-rich receptor-like protein kinase 6 [Capsicum annuum]
MAVWIANRDDPITDTCGILMVTPDGSLMISHSEGNVILFSATPTTNLTAVLLDNGNFVLGELDTYGSVNRVLWQSFDYPTDTLLPGMKLGINLRTAHKWSLTSWVNDQVPASGSFTFGLDPNGTNQLIILWMVNVYWKSGPWPTGQFDFNYVSNEDEEYFIYTANGISGYTMSPSGLIQDRFEGNAKFGNCSNAIPDAGCVKQIARPSVRIIAGVLPMPQSIVTPELAVKFGGTARVSSISLKWNTRLNTIEGVVQGLLYLHKYSRLRVIHRDLKASNILLDDNMNPKISEFGLARIFGRQEFEGNTERIVGTHGYMSPEYAMNGIVSTKTDIFSFGVLVLEILSGKRNNSCYHLERPLNLVGYAWELWKAGRVFEELTEPVLLNESTPMNEVMRCIHVGLLCVQANPMDRPSMSSVVMMLTNDSLQLPVPRQPAFFIGTVMAETETHENVGHCSINGLSISDMVAR